MKQVLGEGVVGHELGDEQALVAVAAVADQVRHPPVEQAPHPLGLLLQPNQTDRQKPARPEAPQFRESDGRAALAHRELLGVGPRELGELLHGNRARRRAAAALELAPVDEVGRLLAALGDDVPGREPARGRAEVRQGELRERRDIPTPAAARAGRGRGPVRVRGRAVRRRWRRRAVPGRLPRRVGPRPRPRPERGAAATHQV